MTSWGLKINLCGNYLANYAEHSESDCMSKISFMKDFKRKLVRIIAEL